MVDSSPKLSGEPTAEALSNGLATLGRYGDNYMVHAAEGETIIPKEILDANPITGQPEFFFKKIFGVIKKVAAKILPIAAPILGNLILPGVGGPIASALLTKMQGGTWGGAAKSAALSYGVGALGRGLQGGFAAGPGGFGERFTTGLGRGLTEPFRAGSQLFASDATNPLAQGIFGPRGTGTFFKGLSGTDFAQQGVGGLFPAYQDQQGISWNQPQRVTSSTNQVGYVDNGPSMGSGSSLNRAAAGSPAANLAGTNVNQYNVGDRFIQGGQNFEVQAAISESGQNIGKRFVKVDDPGFLTKTFGKTGANLVSQAALPLTVAGIAYAMSPKEKDQAEELAQLDAANPRRAAYDQWINIADKTSDEAVRLKAIWYGQPALTESQIAAFGANPLIGVTAGTPGSPAGIATVATGGEIMGPGTGTSDSIPARLSDGEFVMTAEAVRNAGGGDRALGAARMYDMMNQFERGAA